MTLDNYGNISLHKNQYKIKFYMCISKLWVFIWWWVGLTANTRHFHIKRPKANTTNVASFTFSLSHKLICGLPKFSLPLVYISSLICTLLFILSFSVYFKLHFLHSATGLKQRKCALMISELPKFIQAHKCFKYQLF